MSKLNLPSVTLLATDCIDANRMISVLELCKSKVDFGAVRLLTHVPVKYEHKVKIQPLNSLIAYSIFMLTKVYKYIDTPYFLTVQRDGWILNPQSWNDEWLDTHYCAPLFMQYNKCGSGGFSLRKTKMMEDIATIEMPEWDGSEKQAHEIQSGLSYYEDGICSLTERNGKYKIASLEQAADFSQGGNRDPKYFREKPFGFHRTWQEIDFKTGKVDSSDTTKDIHVSYDHEIDNLI